MTDAHCHPENLLAYNQDMERERRETGTAAAASSTSRREFEYHESLAFNARRDNGPPLYCCFALHPQLAPAFAENKNTGMSYKDMEERQGFLSLGGGLDYLYNLAKEGRLDGIGETGFDLYDERFKTSEKVQDEIFTCHLETALKYNLPLILHVRRAMHKIFPFSKELKKLPAVIFHSWPGTKSEGEALIKRGIDVYFSFGTTVLKNHKQAMASAASFPPERILLESDAPWQPLRNKLYSSWQDLEAICSCIASLRKEAGCSHSSREEVENASTRNFFDVFKAGGRRL